MQNWVTVCIAARYRPERIDNRDKTKRVRATRETTLESAPRTAPGRTFVPDSVSQTVSSDQAPFHRTYPCSFRLSIKLRSFSRLAVP